MVNGVVRVGGYNVGYGMYRYMVYVGFVFINYKFKSEQY